MRGEVSSKGVFLHRRVSLRVGAGGKGQWRMERRGCGIWDRSLGSWPCLGYRSLEAGMAERTREERAGSPRCTAGAGCHAPRSPLLRPNYRRSESVPKSLPKVAACRRTPTPPTNSRTWRQRSPYSGACSSQSSASRQVLAHSVFLLPPAKMAVHSRRLAQGMRA